MVNKQNVKRKAFYRMYARIQHAVRQQKQRNCLNLDFYRIIRIANLTKMLWATQNNPASARRSVFSLRRAKSKALALQIKKHNLYSSYTSTSTSY
jgi:hypothetical protein